MFLVDTPAMELCTTIWQPRLLFRQIGIWTNPLWGGYLDLRVIRCTCICGEGVVLEVWPPRSAAWMDGTCESTLVFLLSLPRCRSLGVIAWMMQLGEGQLDETSINAQKVLYDSSDNNNRTQSSSEIHFHLSPSRRKHEAKKFLSHAENREMLGEGQSDAIIQSKDSVDNRKSSLTTEEDPSDGSRHIIIDGISPDRYFISPSSAQDMNPCSLFPYTGSDGTRYSASLHYSSVLPSPGFSSPVYSGRGQCGSGYQFGQSPGCLYPSYQGSAPGVGSMSHAGTGTGLRAQVYLCNRALWLKFHRHQTEMIITKQGRWDEIELFECTPDSFSSEICLMCGHELWKWQWVDDNSLLRTYGPGSLYKARHEQTTRCCAGIVDEMWFIVCPEFLLTVFFLVFYDFIFYRRMFPFLSFNITGLRLNAHYNVFVEIVLADPNHWRFQGGKWVTCGKADNNMQGKVTFIFFVDFMRLIYHWLGPRPI